ncbi:amidohydrolase [Pseudothermotoga hypogea DSM 11164 = NBRC 106472]|uniref:Amidohydrolase n=1 Tax=Pseudothermotoga hypogea DSM 11164 = NBRC 106472 TaxID=1123384 RepID=A0A0X1KRS6_9THEM|nr:MULTISPECIES: amidohydrolase [Pseudothermotoga]AJC74007.1 amidohydrolase [Pseudothermotoga hypogea DSM 11164 = NBRC 106472]MDI6862051.1 amidohydrolase [Pseudothermotoga sp.]
MIAIKGGTVWTGIDTIENGVVLIEDKKIAAVGQNVSIPYGCDVIDAHGKFVTPGLIDAHSHIGLIPEGLDWEYSDVNDFYGPITPQMRAIDAIDLRDAAFSDALNGGVTTVYTGPGSANVIGGIGLVLKTTGRVLKEETALKAALGPKRSREYRSKEPYPSTRMGSVALLKQVLEETRLWMEEPNKVDQGKRHVYAIVARALRRELPVKIHLSTSPDEITAAIRLIKEYNLDASIDHVFGGDLLAEEIKRAGIPVVYGPMMLSRLYSGFKYVNDRIPVELSKHGVLVALMTDHPVIPQKHLRLLATVAVRNGASYDEALKMITVNPAKILHMDDSVGTIEVGKDADLVVWNDHPLRPSSYPICVVVDGKVVLRNF